MSRNDREQRLRQGGLAYVGCVSASLSHEFNNCVTIIGEAAGLLEDLCEFATPDRPITPDRLRRQCEVINRQVSRTQQLIRGMNTFAHSVEDGESPLDLLEELETAVGLSRRLARLRGFRFDLPPESTTVTVQGPRFVFHELLFVLFRHLYDGDVKQGTITLRLAEQAKTVDLLLSAETTRNPNGVPDYATLLAEELGAQLATSRDESTVLLITVTLPRSS
jgi:signal transduction histidine kinase